MYSYDRTAAILPLTIDEPRVRLWLQHLRPHQKIKALVLFKGRHDLQLGASVNFEDGSNERFEIDLQPDWKGDRLTLSPRVRGVR